MATLAEVVAELEGRQRRMARYGYGGRHDAADDAGGPYARGQADAYAEALELLRQVGA